VKVSDPISEEITGKPVTVEIAGRVCLVSYPMHNILLFKKQTGLSLFIAANWNQLDFEADSDAWTACLWAGLHVRQDDGTWASPFSRAELDLLIGLGNAVQVHNAMFCALTNWMPRKKVDNEDETEKKILTATPCQKPETAEIPETTSAVSGSDQPDGFISPAPSF
jgi:hypothetical protein